jgi:hypothetical protein
MKKITFAILRYVLSLGGIMAIIGAFGTVVENQRRYQGGWTTDIEVPIALVVFGGLLLLGSYLLRNK